MLCIGCPSNLIPTKAGSIEHLSNPVFLGVTSDAGLQQQLTPRNLLAVVAQYGFFMSVF